MRVTWNRGRGGIPARTVILALACVGTFIFTRYYNPRRAAAPPDERPIVAPTTERAIIIEMAPTTQKNQ